jgi:hypothetical protein
MVVENKKGGPDGDSKCEQGGSLVGTATVVVSGNCIISIEFDAAEAGQTLTKTAVL